MEVFFPQKSARVFECKPCNLICSRKNDYERHILTRKHIVSVNGSNSEVFFPQNSAKKFNCICGKNYKTHSGLWKHKQICNMRDNNNELINSEQLIEISNDISKLKINNVQKDESNFVMTKDDLKDLIIEVVRNNNELFKQNQDFQAKMFEMLKNSNSITNNMNNCNNQTFNLQFFLNETCKDAMNMSDFINSFNLQISDLERLADDGYVKTMSSLIVNKVRELDVEKRPIHCSDEKRETIYIKEDDVWIKDDEEKSHLRKAVNKIGTKNIGVLQDWQQAHPNCIKSNSPYNDIYLKMMKEILGGRDSKGNENKVIKNIIKEVVIDKQQYLK